jgi:hypothetical protein
VTAVGMPVEVPVMLSVSNLCNSLFRSCNQSRATNSFRGLGRRMQCHWSGTHSPSTANRHVACSGTARRKWPAASRVTGQRCAGNSKWP